MKASLYHSLEDEKVRCRLCHHACVVQPARRGICGVRRNTNGVLETMVYGRLIARNVDPIEKKPLFHLMPGHRSYSIATVGCNFRCRFCQNAEIAQMPHDHGGAVTGGICTPEQVVADALDQDCRSIAYTYTEPTVYFEFAFDTAKLAQSKGLKNVFVSNGYMSDAAIEMAAPFLDGANVDLKAFSEDFYKQYCGASLAPVCRTLKTMRKFGILVEVTTLIIPGLNDDPDELAQLAGFIAGELGPETPWHISRFHPTYRLTDRDPTPIETLRAAYDIGKQAGLHYVYMGNVPGAQGESTHCHQCGAMLIERQGFYVLGNRIENDCCPDCQTPVYGIGISSKE